MIINRWIKCPYCGTENAVRSTEIDSVGPTMHLAVTCDTEAGGCDRLFVAGYRLALEVITLKVEGEEKRGVGEYDPADEAEALTQQWAADGEIAAAEVWAADQPVIASITRTDRSSVYNLLPLVECRHCQRNIRRDNARSFGTTWICAQCDDQHDLM